MLRSLWRKFVTLFPRESDRRTTRQITGERGETAAAQAYVELGYKVLARNWRAGRDEIDLVALAPGGGTPVFIEVKTRRETDPRGGYHAVDARKKTAMRRAIRAYLTAIGRPGSGYRFDIAEVREDSEGNLRVIRHAGVSLFSK